MDITTKLFVLLLFFSYFPEGEGLRVRKKVEIIKNKLSSDSNPLITTYETRKGRFLNPFSLFSVVTFENTECTTSAGTQGAMGIRFSLA